MLSSLIKIAMMGAEFNKIAEKWADKYDEMVAREKHQRESQEPDWHKNGVQLYQCPHCGAKKDYVK